MYAISCVMVESLWLVSVWMAGHCVRDTVHAWAAQWVVHNLVCGGS